MGFLYLDLEEEVFDDNIMKRSISFFIDIFSLFDNLIN